MPARPIAPLRPRCSRRPWAAPLAALALVALAGTSAQVPSSGGARAAMRPLQGQGDDAAIFLPLAYGGAARFDEAVRFAGLAIVADPGSTVNVVSNYLMVRPSSAEDGAGFTALTEDAGGFELTWERLDAARLAPGMSLEIASADAQGATLGRITLAPGDLGLDIRVEPAGLGGGTHHLEARLAGRVVVRLDGHSGVAARVATWPTGVGRVEARPGGLPAMRLRWDRAVSLNVPGGPIVDADELLMRSEAAAAPAVMDRFTLRATGIPRVHLLPPVLRLPLEGCAEAAPIAPDGSIVFPAERDPEATPATVDVADDFAGYTGALYGAAHDTDMDTWYQDWPCDAALGEPAQESPPLGPELAALGLTSDAAVIAAELTRLDAAIGASTAPGALGPTTAVDAAFEEPAAAFRPDAGTPYGGRDIVFVHELVADPLADAVAGDAAATAGWATDFGGGDAQTANPAFYLPGGYWKAAADASWATHIGRLAGYSGRDNRYLTVAWPATQRLDVAAHALLTQLAGAMADGTGVVVPVGGNAEGFCQRPNCVIVSHGAGALLTDLALHLAATGAYSGTAFAAIPPRIKAQVALHGAFGGSELAAAVVGQALGLAQLPDGCQLATHAYRMLDPDAQRSAPACAAMAPLADSALRDLVPSVAAERLAGIGASSIVPTLLVAGAHATYPSVLKHAALPGFDDGMLTLDSQCASPNAPANRPSRVLPEGPEGRSFDLGLALQRAQGYARDQAPTAMAAGCTPFTSPAGMLQPVADRLAGTMYDALARTPGHHTFLVTASDHEIGPRAGRIDRDYQGSLPSGARSWEEVRVVTDPAVYAEDARFATVDPAPLVARPPEVGVHERGRKVVFNVLRNGRTYERTWWLWRRTYLQPAGSETRDAVDYVYQHVLRP